MNEKEPSSRASLFRESLVFQLKLMADGFRDLVLVPVSLIATLAGMLRGGSEPDREFRQVIALGKQTEAWINLFGNHEESAGSGQAASLDALLNRAEEVVREQTRAGGITENAAKAVEKTLQAAQRASLKHDRPAAGRDQEI